MDFAFEQIFEGAGFFSQHGDHSLDFLDGGEVVGR